MLYVFHVDQGRMLKFDMNLALSNVRSLKETISRVHGLPVAHQVLLVSGGEALYPNSLVCSYSAGTDTNPIYMFSTEESKNTPQPWPSIEFDQDIKEQVDRSLSLPATYATVVTRAQIAQKYFDLAREQETLCENMIHEQHLQHQGWSAVIANLEDLTDDFKQRVEIFFEYVNEHQSKSATYFEMLTQFREDLNNLSKIPILPGLMPNANQEFIGLEDVNEELYNLQRATQLVYENITSKELILNMELGEIQEQEPELEPESQKKENESESEETSLEANKNKSLTLLEWISSTENNKQLRYLAQACLEGLHFFNKEKMTTLSNKIAGVLKQAGQEDIKAIKGIEDRLSALEQIIFKLKNSVQEQKELATAFQQNQNRASNLGDPSILPDLCASHRSQLLVMVNNQHIIRENMRRVFKAKEELGKNLSRRLQFIVRIENSMSEYDNNLLFYHRSLRRLERHLNIVEQIHQTPLIYMHAVSEVVRRRIFSNYFRSWSQELACDTHTIYNEEIMRRQDFSALFEGHFLNTLFPGMEDMPPPYATEVPAQFDSLLPTLTESDIDVLSTHLPHIEIKLPDLGDVIQFFTSRLVSKSDGKRSLSEGKMQSTVAEITLQRPIELHAHLKDEFESETDTEEFEKVGQSPNDQQNNTATVATSTSDTEKPDTISISTSTEIITTHNIETLTEGELLQSCPPKKPPRLTKMLSSSKSSEFSLPVIPEVFTPHHIPISDSFAPFHYSTLSSSSEDPSPSSPCSNQNQKPVYLGHQHSSSGDDITAKKTIHSQQVSSPASPYPMNNNIIDNEFVNSEFYIDESLPSSLNDEDNTQENETENCDQLMQQADDHQTIKKSEEKQVFSRRSNSNEYITTNLHHGKISFENRESLETVIILLQENLGSTRLEVERMRSIVSKMSQISTQSLNIIKTNLDVIRSQTHSDRLDLESDIKEISIALNNINAEWKRSESELAQRLTVEHELELSDARKNINSKDSEIKKLITEREGLDASHIQIVQNCEKETDVLKQDIVNLTTQMEKLQLAVNTAETLKEKTLNECREKLIQSHKTEIESLRCRFKLMASMERSPSDTSLEKIERPDVIDIACHESIVHQTREDLKAEQEQAVKTAIEIERKKWINKGHPGSAADGTSDMYKKIFDEKEKQLDTMREREDILTKENQSLRLKVQSLAQDNDYNDVVWLKNMVDTLSKEKTRLEQELKRETEKSNPIDMASSTASTLKGSAYAIPDPSGAPVPALPRDTSNAVLEVIGARPKMSSSQMGSKQNITTETCSKGDQVFIVWSEKHWQYVLVQDSSTHYFLHGESYSGLNLKLPCSTESEKLPHPLYTMGRVLEKEYCHARKDENRYKVPKGTKFYRVKVIPIPRPVESNRQKRERNESTSSSNSMPVSRSTSTQHLIDSFAQTESPPIILDRSMVDSGVAEQQRSDYKERTLSVTEEDEPISLLEERCRYISISEEEEKVISEAAANQDSNSLQIPTESSSEKDQEDSDEYRSLEAKDDLEFPTGVI